MSIRDDASMDGEACPQKLFEQAQPRETESERYTEHERERWYSAW